MAFPRWSPDGQSIAANGWQGDAPLDVFRLEVASGFVRRLTSDTAWDSNPTWSHDGRWLYYTSNRTGSFQLWKMPATGGDARQLTRQGGVVACETDDGRWIYYNNRPFGSLWRMPADGGPETLVLDRQVQASKWTIWQDRIIYIDEPPGKEHELVMFDPHTRRNTPLGSIGKAPSWPGLAVSPDGEWILNTQTDQVTGDIMMVENFR
jgi:dipeptidyl aminopeptidase/acylaminoacyl peptidase